MAPPRPPRARDRQRGNTLLIALIVLSALATLGSLTVVSVQSSLKTSTNDRAQAIAMYAAESGAAAAMDFLRNNWSSTNAWSNFVTPSNGGIAMAAIPGNDVPPEDTANSLFSKELNASFHVELRNNSDDPGYATPGFGSNDQDGRIIIRSTGHGPQGSQAIIEWEVQRVPQTAPPWDPSTPSTQPLILLGWHVVTMQI